MVRGVRLLLANLLCLLVITVPSAARSPNLSCSTHPFADPKDDPCNFLKYIASNVLTSVAFGLIITTALVQTWFSFRVGGKFMSCMVIGEYTFAIGIATRYGLHSSPDAGRAIYIAEYLLVVLSPCAFIASEYVLLGRMTQHLDCARYLMVPARRVTPIFVLSDITTFLIQAAGGSLFLATNKPNLSQLGSHIFLAGLALQLASFLAFTFIYLIFLYRVRKYAPKIWRKDAGKKWYKDWRTLGAALLISCISILIRSVYRTTEQSEGFLGRLATTEAFFYGLDTLPLFIAIVIYVPFWPGRFIRPHETMSEIQEMQVA